MSKPLQTNITHNQRKSRHFSFNHRTKRTKVKKRPVRMIEGTMKNEENYHYATRPDSIGTDV